MKHYPIIAICLILISTLPLLSQIQGAEKQILKIKYLDHSGWMIETPSRVLIFDYWERIRRQKLQNPKDFDCEIDPKTLKNKKVVVFISHAHSDHFDPVTLAWQKIIPDITYVFGWEYQGPGDFIRCRFRRESLDIDGMKVKTVVHNFDKIPESAFLVEVDGFSIYFGGDHNSSRWQSDQLFLSNIAYLATQAPQLDLAFVATFGGEMHIIETLKPAYTIPMHDGGNERQYAKFAEKLKKRGLQTIALVAKKQGDIFQVAK